MEKTTFEDWFAIFLFLLLACINVWVIDYIHNL